jgi:hypothetical protein
MTGKMQSQSLYTVVISIFLLVRPGTYGSIQCAVPSGIFALGTHRVIYLLRCPQFVGNGVANTQIFRINCAAYPFHCFHNLW